MSFVVQPVVESDGVEWTRIYYYAFQSTLGYLWPKELTDDDFVCMSGEHTPTLKESDTYTFKAVDKASNKMVGVAQWQIFKEGVSEVELEAMSAEMSPPLPQVNHEARTALLKDIFLLRRELMLSKSWVLLRMLIVNPEYQKKGVGSLLMQWGLEQMDQLGIRGYLEASVHGKGLYEKCGYKMIREVEFDPRPWGASYLNTHFVMIREPTSMR